MFPRNVSNIGNVIDSDAGLRVWILIMCPMQGL